MSSPVKTPQGEGTKKKKKPSSKQMDTMNKNGTPEDLVGPTAFWHLTVLSRDDQQAPRAEAHVRVTREG